MTFSLVARSPDARLFGMAIASSSPAVAARCAHARAGAGVVATQNITDPALGPQILQTLAAGAEETGAAMRSIAESSNRAAMVAAEAVTVVQRTTETVARRTPRIGSCW